MSAVIVMKFVRFFRTLTIPTPRYLRLQKPLRIIPTNSTFTGSQMRTMSVLKACSWTTPRKWHATTSTKEETVWKRSIVVGASTSKDESTALFIMIMLPEAKQ